MAKEYHLVFGESAQAGLEQSGSVNISDINIEIICVKDNLNVGKLFDLKTLEGLEDRVTWFENFHQEIDSYYYRENHIQVVRDKLNEITSDDTIYMWFGNDGNEFIWKAAILNFLKDINISIYVIDWSDITFFNIYNEEISPWSLNVSSLSNIKIASQNFRMLTNKEKNDYNNLWNKLLKNNTDLRVLNIYNQIEESDIAYYDNVLISNCKTDFQHSHKVVGEAIGDLHNGFNSCGIGDSFLSERLKHLCYNGELQMRNQEHGQENGIRFEVRLVN